MTLHEKIVLLRKQQGLSQEELAARLGLSRQAVSRWETGTALPDAANLLQLSRLFGVSADYLLDDACTQPRSPKSDGESLWLREGRWLVLSTLVCLVGLCFTLGSFFYAATHPWIYNGIDGLLGSFLGTHMLVPFVGGLLVLGAGLGLCLWRVLRRGK